MPFSVPSPGVGVPALPKWACVAGIGDRGRTGHQSVCCDNRPDLSASHISLKFCVVIEEMGTVMSCYLTINIGHLA